MRSLMVLIIAVLWLVSGCAYTKDAVMTEKTDDYTVTASFGQSLPIVGDNTLLVTINDQAGKAVTNASVRIDYYMTAYKTSGRVVQMSAHGGKAEGEINDSGYRATLNFSMTGYWQVEVKIARYGKEQTAKFFTVVK